jgi:hypothetical protein
MDGQQWHFNENRRCITYRLVRALSGNIQIFRLNGGEGCQFDVELGKMGASNLFIEFLGQYVDAERKFLRGSPEGDLSEDLVSEGARHHKGGVSSSAAENDQF